MSAARTTAAGRPDGRSIPRGEDEGGREGGAMCSGWSSVAPPLRRRHRSCRVRFRDLDHLFGPRATSGDGGLGRAYDAQANDPDRAGYRHVLLVFFSIFVIDRRDGGSGIESAG